MDCFPQDRKIEGVINLEMDHEREDEIIKREMFGKERVPVTDKDSRWNGKDQDNQWFQEGCQMTSGPGLWRGMDWRSWL